MTRPDDGAPVTDLHLERYRLGELPEDERARVEGRLAVEPGLRGRLDALAVSEAEIARLHPAPAMAERIRSRAAGAPSPATRVWPDRPWLVPALAAATVVLAVGLTAIRQRPPAGGVRL